MKKSILCVVHDDGPKDDRASAALSRAGHDITWVCPAAGEALPSAANGFDAAIVYGGVQSANDRDKHGYIGNELDWIGAWAAAKLGDAAASAKIGMLDLNVSQPTVGVLRDQGFLTGFGIDVKDPGKWGDEDDPRIVGNDVTSGNEEGGRKAMENLLLIDPMINVVYTINEPSAAGAYETLKSFGKEEGVLIVSVDGGCPGVKDVEAGVIGATSQQYPLLMASLGIEAIAAWAKDGAKPANTPGLDFFNTGVSLVTGEAVDGVPSIGIAEGLDRCWG